MEDRPGSIADYLEDTIENVDTLRLPETQIIETPTSYWTPLRIFIAISGGVILLLIITYIYRAYKKGDYFVKNTFDNDMKFIRQRLGFDVPVEPVEEEPVEDEPVEKPHIIEDLPPTKKNGWCYVGTDRGIRSCIDVGYNETCISQDIYPSRDKCINPNLRYD